MNAEQIAISEQFAARRDVLRKRSRELVGGMRDAIRDPARRKVLEAEHTAVQAELTELDKERRRAIELCA